MPRKSKKHKVSTDSEIGLSILKCLRKITRVIDLNSKKLASECNLTAPQVLTLHTANDIGPTTLANIAQEIHLSPSTLVGVVDRLESKGLLVRERSKTDRRQIMIRTTELGKKTAKKSPLPLQEKLLESLENVSESQQKNIVKSLEALVELLGANNIQASPILGNDSSIK